MLCLKYSVPQYCTSVRNVSGNVGIRNTLYILKLDKSASIAFQRITTWFKMMICGSSAGLHHIDKCFYYFDYNVNVFVGFCTLQRAFSPGTEVNVEHSLSKFC